MSLRRSWVKTANSALTDFPLNNLPYGVFSVGDDDPRCGVAIGDKILDMAAVDDAGLIDLASSGLFDLPYWNDVMEMGRDAWTALRTQLTNLLDEATAHQAVLQTCLVDQSNAQMHMPIAVSEFTDFYASKHHATNVGTMFRGADNALPPNWLDMPIGYNGRASTVVVSGTDILRPNGQIKLKDATAPVFGPTKRLDIELELGAIIGQGNEMGLPVSTQDAEAMIFGYVLLNDWSARDIQAWEYQPLGPFQAKAFATTISPWIVTPDALAPFRKPTPPRDRDLLPYLHEPHAMLFDIDLEVALAPKGKSATTIARTNYDRMYYSAPQQLAHHASSGCAMQTGDLLGSGTISGPGKDERGSLLELTWGGTEPLALDTGDSRTFLEDDDQVTLRGAAKGDGYKIGFGTCVGTIRPAPQVP